MAWVNRGAVYGIESGPIGLRLKDKITAEKIIKYMRDNAGLPIWSVLRKQANIVVLGEYHWAIPPKATLIAGLMVGLSKSGSQNMLYFASEYFKRSMRSKITAYVEAPAAQRMSLAATLPDIVLEFKKVMDLAAMYPGGRCAVLVASDTSSAHIDPTLLANERNALIYNVQEGSAPAAVRGAWPKAPRCW